jgi:hypothetical protein
MYGYKSLLDYSLFGLLIQDVLCKFQCRMETLCRCGLSVGWASLVEDGGSGCCKFTLNLQVQNTNSNEYKVAS